LGAERKVLEVVRLFSDFVLRRENALKKAFLLALVLFVVTAFVACGGDDGTDDAVENNEPQAEADTALSEEEFLAQGNEICAAGTKAIDDALGDLEGSGPPSGAESEAFLEVLVNSIQGQIDGLRALEPPEELAADVDSLLADAQAALDKIEDAGVKIFEQKKDPFAEVNKAAGALGLEKCAE
jgi:hypothetical protein